MEFGGNDGQDVLVRIAQFDSLRPRDLVGQALRRLGAQDLLGARAHAAVRSAGVAFAGRRHGGQTQQRKHKRRHGGTGFHKPPLTKKHYLCRQPVVRRHRLAVSPAASG
jgi:hypothetical protein